MGVSASKVTIRTFLSASGPQNQSHALPRRAADICLDFRGALFRGLPEQSEAIEHSMEAA
jgi:hypothetical protein